MDLGKFKSLVEQWIQQKNLRLSGVALLSDGTNEIWSASLIVDGEGPWPTPDAVNIEDARQLCADDLAMLSDFTFHDIQLIQFIMSPDTRAKRWQVQWTFRDSRH